MFGGPRGMAKDMEQAWSRILGKPSETLDADWREVCVYLFRMLGVGTVESNSGFCPVQSAKT